MRMPDTQHAFVATQMVHDHFGEVQLERREVGNLVLTSGQIVANDPLVLYQTDPFSRAVQPGKYPVWVCTVRLQHENGSKDQRVAYAWIQFKAGAAAKWEMAVWPDTDVSILKEKEYYGYGVDAGIGGFMDAQTAQLIKAKTKGLAFQDAEKVYGEPLMDILNMSSNGRYSAGEYVVDPTSGANVVAFSSGWGDGEYPSYWGLDEAGEIVCLLTDFCLLK